MARRPKPLRPIKQRPAPPLPPLEPDTPAPPAAELLTGPRVFAGHLEPHPIRWWRYLPVVVLSSLLAGVAYAVLLARASAAAAAHLNAPAPGLALSAVNVLGGVFLGLFTFTLMWGLGRLGGGVKARPAEVYGASFALLPPLWLLVIVWTLLTPAGAFSGPASASAPTGSPGELNVLAGQLALGTQAAFLLILVTLIGTAAQFALAYPALRALTGTPGRALLAALLPVIPALAVQFVSVAPVLFAH